MALKPSLILFVCACCAAGPALAQDDVPVLVAAGMDGAQDLPTQLALSLDEAHGALPMPAMAPEMSRMGPFALSASERLQLREQITKAAQDIYAEQRILPAPGGVAPVSP